MGTSKKGKKKARDEQDALDRRRFPLHSLEITGRPSFAIKCLAILEVEGVKLPLHFTIKLNRPSNDPLVKIVKTTRFVDTEKEEAVHFYEQELWCKRFEDNVMRASISLILRGKTKPFKVFAHFRGHNKYSGTNVRMTRSMNRSMKKRSSEYSSSDVVFEGNVSLKESKRIHEILEHGFGFGFKWPDTNVDEGQLDLSGINAREIGYLKYLGYTVGVNGLPSSERKRILARAYSSDLPSHFPESEVKQWGLPSTCRRLKKCADCLASFARNLKRKDMKNARKARRGEYSQGVIDWERDLTWLKSEYYYLCSFTWPNTNI